MVDVNDAQVLLTDARALLEEIENSAMLNRPAINALHARLQAFHPDYRRISYGSVRLIRERSLLLLEMALELCRSSGDTSAAGCQLAARYCEHYEARYGTSLNGPSRERVQAIDNFVKQREAQEASGVD